MGTLGVAEYMDVLTRIKEMLTLAGKKYYTFVMGKLNPAKLANFMEIDVFVVIACPENSLVSGSGFAGVDPGEEIL
jgi:diphthamide biosynthesis protein 2